jgi:hypothetical protein
MKDICLALLIWVMWISVFIGKEIGKYVMLKVKCLVLMKLEEDAGETILDT